MSAGQWEQYTEEEKQGIMASLPPTRQEQLSKLTIDPGSKDEVPALPPLSEEFCLKDTYLKRAVARFKRDLSDGYYEKSWSDKAKRAHEERLQGKFDDYLRQHAEELFQEDEEDDVSPEDEVQEDFEAAEYQVIAAKGGKAKRTRS